MTSTVEGKRKRYTFAGAGYFNRMKKLGLYSIEREEISSRVKKANLENIFAQRLI
jgi:hypothetical protein